jgi:hypothetical protein
MDLLFKHLQEKKERKSSGTSICNLFLYSGNTDIQFNSQFELDYHRYGSKKHVTFEHSFSIDINNGNVITTYRIVNEGLTDDKMFRNCFIKKTNDFKLFFDLTENGFLRGEKRNGFWGVRYYKAINEIVKKIYEILKPNFIEQYHLQKNYTEKPVLNSLYDMIVDFHLDRKRIKSHDNVYLDIQYDYPKKKFLIENDNKFLPAILDQYGIKSKYLISELNKKNDRPVHILTLNYLCKLFGSNYIDYIKKINWENHCYEQVSNKKTHTLKNDSEKNCMVSMINKWEKDTIRTDSLVYNINKMLSTRDLLESRGVDLKFKAKNDNEFDNLMETWSGIKLHFSRGFKVKYNFPEEFIKDIETEITINEQIFKVKILSSEEDFRLEGFTMKNCMSKQFPHGSVYIYVALQYNKKRINLQYRKGKLVQSYGKANTPVTKDFNDAIEILNKKFYNNIDIEWNKEKYEFLSH